MVSNDETTAEDYDPADHGGMTEEEFFTTPEEQPEFDGSHFGDPCIYCGAGYGDVAVGECPGPMSAEAAGERPDIHEQAPHPIATPEEVANAEGIEWDGEIYMAEKDIFEAIERAHEISQNIVNGQRALVDMTGDKSHNQLMNVPVGGGAHHFLLGCVKKYVALAEEKYKSGDEVLFGEFLNAGS